MLVILFRSKRTNDTQGYTEMNEQMLKLAKRMPGFVGLKSFTAEDGERLTVVWWEDETSLRAWRAHPDHRLAQRLGRQAERQEDLVPISMAKKFRIAAVGAGIFV